MKTKTDEYFFFISRWEALQINVCVCVCVCDKVLEAFIV